MFASKKKIKIYKNINISSAFILKKKKTTSKVMAITFFYPIFSRFYEFKI